MATNNSFLVEITGQTEFHLGNPSAPIAVDIAVGYRSRITEDATKESFLYATLTSENKNGISVQDIINCCTTKQEVIPEILNAVTFKQFSVTYGSGGIEASEFKIEFNCKIKINESYFDAVITIDYQKNSSKTAFAFGGILSVDEHRFVLNFVQENEAGYVYAAYQNSGKTTIDLRNLAAKFFGDSVTNKMPALSFTLEKFKAFLLYKKEKNTSGLFFGMGADLNLDLEELPLAGPVLTQGNAFGFKEVLAIYANGTFEKEELKRFEGLPPVAIGSGFNITTQLEINGVEEYYALNEGTDQQYKEPEQPQQPAVTSVTPLGDGIIAKAKWKKLDKKIGPVTLQRLGFAYQDSKVVLLLDASMEMKGMGMQLMGFGLGFKLQWPPGMPDFYLEGLGLSYKAPPIEISGAFLHTTAPYKETTIDVYNGGAIIKVSRFTISAIGSYAKVADEASLFIYGVFDGPIGGPAFFFVTGIAAGFGYNRKINVPSINEVALFPLVALAMRPEEDQGLLPLLTSLETPMKNGKKPIEISIGDYWLAVGIKFTSFKLIESFVLLTVNFGTQLEFAILGLSRLSWPEKSMAPEPIVYVELAILAHFGPGSDVISVEAVITPNSYVLSKDCKLSGGFAFYTWIKGLHEGDFVITLGGYHPKFVKPAHYPTVPRLALSWKISSLVSIKGEMYYALTASAIMAGGKWEVLFKTSIISASIVIWADMLISWAPFHYYIDMGITVKIEADIKILFVRIHFSFEMGAELHIWGPPFAGEAYVDWTIFSFTIPFGDHSKKAPKKLLWEEFATGFIPQKKNNGPVNARLKEGKANTVSNPDPTNITISNGLIEVKGEAKFPIINPHQLAITIDSFIPVSELKINDKEVPESTVIKSETGNIIYANREKNIGIRPCGFTKGTVAFEMNVDVVLNNTKMDVMVSGIAKGVAEALWGGEESKSNNANPGTSKVLTNVLSGVIIQPPVLPQVAQIRTFDFSVLFDASKGTFDWKFTLAKTGEAYHAFEVLGYYDEVNNIKVTGILEKTYDESSVKEKREKMVALLKTGFDESFPDIDEEAINRNMTNDDDYFTGIPVICEIGQLPQYSTDVE
ncbi:DUF6603 domain-containing protein [Flavobacterium cerinum]|uniref:DUF6603 domain-containing protein n=1 Tax=Flavobacterium cerinum TaxID=2502784 RepID=A0ABY5IUK9_9FLAO|nr:DUF6603 domain-containing protein [Flavobacterium cerinum]UUC45156.1 hypothetical protein NOX80_16215 [Flavobacterium cerinum]